MTHNIRCFALSVSRPAVAVRHTTNTRLFRLVAVTTMRLSQCSLRQLKLCLTVSSPLKNKGIFIFNGVAHRLQKCFRQETYSGLCNRRQTMITMTDSAISAVRRFMDFNRSTGGRPPY